MISVVIFSVPKGKRNPCLFSLRCEKRDESSKGLLSALKVWPLEQRIAHVRALGGGLSKAHKHSAEDRWLEGAQVYVSPCLGSGQTH